MANFVMSFDLPLAGPNLEPPRAEGRCIDSSSGSIDQSPPFPASGGEAGHRLQRRRAPFVLAVGGVDNAIERCLFLSRHQGTSDSQISMPRSGSAGPVLDPKSLYKRAQSFPRDALNRYNRLSRRSKVSQVDSSLCVLSSCQRTSCRMS